jgi:hypothetical protein
MSAIAMGAIASSASRPVVGVQAVRSWLSRKPSSRSLRLELDGDSVEMSSDLSDADAQRLVQEFLLRHSEVATADETTPERAPFDRQPLDYSRPERSLDSHPSEPVQSPPSPAPTAAAPPAPATTSGPVHSPPAVTAAADDQHAKRVDNVGQAVTVVAAYIPSEALAAYIAITAILAPATLASRGTVMFLALALNIVFVLTGYAYDQQSITAAQSRTINRRAKFRAIGVASWALLAYAAAMPDGLLTSFDWYKLQYGGVVALVSAILLPLIAPISPVLRTGQTPPI